MARGASRTTSGRGEPSTEATDVGAADLQPAPPRATVTEVIDNLGLGLAQVRATALSGSVFFADGAELLLVSSVTRAVSEEWSFTGFQRSSVVSVVYVGMLIGNVLGGPLGDQLGRRLPILLSFFLIFACSLLSSVSWGFASLAFFRCLVGMAVGIGGPAQQTLVNEVTPSKWRVLPTSATEVIFGLGELFTGLLLLADDPTMAHLHWRALLVIGAIPSAVFGLLAFALLQQSPLYLVCHDRIEEARAVLECMQRDNGAHQVSIDFTSHGVLRGGKGTPYSLGHRLLVVFGRELRVTTLIAMFSFFSLNFSYFGALYAFPQIMVNVDFGSTPAGNLICGSLMEILGIIVAYPCVFWFPRKPTMRLYFFLMTVAFLAFGLGCSGRQGSSTTQVLLDLGFYGNNLFRMMGFIVWFVYSSEVYPTVTRATGTALCFASGRLAAIMSPILYELTLELFGKSEVFFHFAALANLVNLAMVGWLPFETFGKPLQEESTED
eukprot:CAMPEP_0179139924 /NCGR_PEP_ID=MMETSP0796-20121207/66962_1 /TAXON_ID=73915 /ORGANISM="Pyrodinium bahamense, Strain pbaha01" /LENGTH=493 /DNA_ID=CAMNT_0020839413 /DNA_START=1 /DNA_END=1482 /DNA_ORIENTATION=-